MTGALTDRQRRVIPFLLVSPSTEEACRRAKINKTTVYACLKEEPFREELRRQQEEVVRGALETLKASSAKAAATLVKLLDSDKESIQARVAEDIIEFTQKAIEHEELEKRIEALEAKMNQQGRITDEYPAGASVARRVTAPSRKISDSDLIFPGRSFQTKDRKIYSRRRFFEKIQRLTARVRYAQAHPELTNGKWSTRD